MSRTRWFTWDRLAIVFLLLPCVPLLSLAAWLYPQIRAEEDRYMRSRASQPRFTAKQFGLVSYYDHALAPICVNESGVEPVDGCYPQNIVIHDHVWEANW